MLDARDAERERALPRGHRDALPRRERPVGREHHSAPREALAALGSAARIVGEVGGGALAIAGERPGEVAELARVHAQGLAALLH